MQTTSHPFPKRVLIVEDDFLVGEKLSGILEDSGYQVVGDTASGRQAVEMTETLQPDVIMMDINLLEMDGLAAAKTITARCPTPIVALTAHESAALVAQASEAGIGYYLIKPASRRDVSRAIEIAAARFDDLMQMRELNAALQEEIVERQRAEKRLASERAFLLGILDNIAESIIICNKGGQIIRFNEAARRLHGLPEQPIPPAQWAAYYDLYRADGHTLLPTEEIPLFRALQGEHVQDAEIVVAPKHSRPRSLVCNGRALTDETGQKIGAVIAMHDITARKRTEEAVRQERERLDNILSALETGLTLINPDMTIAWTNRKIAQMFPHTQSATGQLCHRFYENQETPCEGCGTQIAFQTGEVHVHERKNPLTGRWYTIIAQPIKDEQGNVINVLEGITDITARKQSEAKLQAYADHLEEMVEEKVRALEEERAKAIQLDKMAALGEMATGIAHELNQPLTAITFEADFLKTSAAQLRASAQSIEEIAKSLGETGENLAGDVERCRRIVDHLRTFGRMTKEPVQSIDLNQPISNSFILAGARLRHSNVDVRLDLAEDLPSILADPHKLEQVFLNLISNAEYAMEKQAEQAPTPDYQKVLEITTAIAGEHVIARVRDNGCGIPPEEQKRLFDPFFTTKPAGEGTGLGLSISYGIVTDVGGDIECESVVGEGTTFTLRFPISS
ncbi:MAG: ATP-binding protein [Anaerolineales bacterium]